MKNFIATLKAFIMATVAWFNHWAKDKILHFTLADNIATVVWIGATLVLGWLLAQEWVTAICAVITCMLILLKDFWLDETVDWQDILAGVLGLVWALAKIVLLRLCWRLLQ